MIQVIISRVGIATDDEIRNSRYYEFISEQKHDTGRVRSKSKKEEANVRRSRSFSYTATAEGHSQDGTVFDIAKERE